MLLCVDACCMQLWVGVVCVLCLCLNVASCQCVSCCVVSGYVLLFGIQLCLVCTGVVYCVSCWRLCVSCMLCVAAVRCCVLLCVCCVIELVGVCCVVALLLQCSGGYCRSCW